MSVFACADLHGRYDLFKEIQNFLAADDKLYVIGDVFDRGPGGWAIYKAIKEDDRITLLMGNHEMLAAKGLVDRMTHPPLGNWDYSLWVDYNGGHPTFDAIYAEYNDGNFSSLIEELNELPIMAEYVNKDDIHITMVHSGYVSMWKEDCVWDRKRYLDPKWTGAENELIVHGHTPIELLINDFKKYHLFSQECKKYTDGAFWYCDNHKVCLDTAAFWYGTTVVLDLDTFDEHIFEGEKNLNG